MTIDDCGFSAYQSQYVAFRANDTSNDVWIASSTDGHTFSSSVLAGQTMDGYSSPALVASNGVLYYIY